MIEVTDHDEQCEGCYWKSKSVRTCKSIACASKHCQWYAVTPHYKMTTYFTCP
jgi:hypothetical protein